MENIDVPNLDAVEYQVFGAFLTVSLRNFTKYFNSPEQQKSMSYIGTVVVH